MGATQGAPANAGHIVTIAEGDLHRLMDLCERAVDSVDRKLPEAETRSAAFAQELADTKAILEEVRISYRALDDRLDRDYKKHRHDTPVQQRACDALGDAMWDALGYYRRNYRGLPERYREANKRAGEQGPADQIEETSNIGGITVPTDTSSDIAYYKKSTGLARNLCFTGTMRTNAMNVPAIDESGVPTVYYVNQGKSPDGMAGGARSVVTFLTNKQLTAKTVMAVQLLEQEMLDDTEASDFKGFWARVFIDQFRLKEDKAVFSETSTDANSAFTGAVQAVTTYSSGANLVTLGGNHFSAITFDDLCNMQNIPTEGAQGRAVWVGSRSTLRYIQALRDSQGRPIISSMWSGMLPHPDPLPNGVLNSPTVLLGAPYYVTPAMPTTVSGSGKVCLLYGDFAEGHYFFDRMKLEIGFSLDAAYGTGGVMFRMRERFAALNVLTAGFSGAKNA